MTSPSLMHETGHSKPVHWDNIEEWDGEESGRDFRTGGHMYTHGWFMSAAAAAAAKLLQSCPTLCNPMDCSPSGFSVHGILQARILEWVAIFFSNAWKSKVKVKSLSRVRPSATPWTAAYQAPPSMGFSRQEYWSRMPSPSPSKFHIYALMYCIGVFLSDLLHSV